jgi:hypothetical protein
MVHKLLALLSALCLCACFSNHEFRRTTLPSGEPDFVALKAAYETVKPDSVERGDLVATRWAPLIHFAADDFEEERTGGYPRGGHNLSRARAWGPVFCVLESEEWHWNAAGELYERETNVHVLWGCFRKRELLVRTDTGWRRETRRRWWWIHSHESIEYTSESAPR